MGLLVTDCPLSKTMQIGRDKKHRLAGNLVDLANFSSHAEIIGRISTGVPVDDPAPSSY